MGKDVVNFDVSQDYYITKAIECEAKEDLVNAVSMLRRAIELQDDLFLRLKLASYYESMSLYNEASDIYIQIISEKGPVLHCFFALFDNMMHLGNNEAASFYVNQYHNLAISEDEKQDISDVMQKHIDVLMKEEYSEVPKWVKLPKSKYFIPGVKALSRNKFPEAIANFLSVPIESQDGIKALEGIMHAYRSMNNQEMAQTYADKILTLDGFHQNALIEKLRSAILSQNNAVFEEYIQKIISIDFAKERDVMFISYELNNLGQFEPAIYILQKYLEKSPYSKPIKYRYAAICYNNGYYSLAFQQFSDLVKTSDPFGIAMYQRNLCIKNIDKNNTQKPKKNIDIYPCIPNSEVKKRIDYIIKCIATMQTCFNKETIEEIWNNSRFKLDLSYCLMAEKKTIVYGALPILLDFDCDCKNQFFNNVLISTMYSNEIKRELIFQMSKKQHVRKISFTYDCVLYNIKIDRDVKNYSQVFQDAYAYFLFVLSPIASGYERQLKKIMKVTFSEYTKKHLQYDDEKSLAAFFAIKVDIMQGEINQETICEMFECNCDTLKKYTEEIKI